MKSWCSLKLKILKSTVRFRPSECIKQLNNIELGIAIYCQPYFTVRMCGIHKKMCINSLYNLEIVSV